MLHRQRHRQKLHQEQPLASSVTPTEQSIVPSAPPVEPPASTSIDETKLFELTYTPSTLVETLEKRAKVPHLQQVTSQVVDNATVIIYENDAAEEVTEFFAALQTNTATYELGHIGYGGTSEYEIDVIETLGQAFIKVIGSIGANAPVSNYVSLAEAEPFLLHIEAHTIEADVDEDGMKEIVATVGTEAQTTIYKMVENSLVSVNLNELMNAKVVFYNKQSNTFQAEVVQGQLSSWKIAGNQLQLIKFS